MGGGAGSRGWVLVAEDDSPTRQGTVELLRGAGFRVDVAEDGAAALELLAKIDVVDALPHVLLTDLDMPRVSGAELILLLRNDPRYRRLGIIVLSGFEQGALPVNRVDRMIAKPARADTLIRAIEDLCARGPSDS